MALQGETVLVTGATGFLGGALVQRLLVDGVRVRALVRSEQRGRDLAARGVGLVVGDLTDPEALRRAVAGCAVVFSVGAALHGPAAEQYAINVTGVGQLVDAAHQAGVRRVVHVSSIAVYGYDRFGVLSEVMPARPGIDHYGQSKALGERVLFERAAALGQEAVVVRPGMIYGPGSGAWTTRVFQLARRKPAPLPGRGSTYCPIVFVDDVVDLLVTAAVHPGAPGEIFNAVTDEPVTWREYIGAYASMAGHDLLLPVPLPVLQALALLVEPGLRLFGEPQPVRAMLEGFFARRRAYSMNKAARLLDWRPRVGLVEGMAAAEAWLRETGQLN